MSKRRLLFIGLVEDEDDKKDTGSLGRKKQKPNILLKRKHLDEENQDDSSENTQVKIKKDKLIDCTEVSDASATSSTNVKQDGKDEGKDEPHSPCAKCLYCSDHFPQASNEKKRYQCSDCKENGLRRTFASQERLDSHIKSAHDAEESGVVFVCRECEEPPLEFKSKAKYMYHLGSKHPGAIYFVCEICAATYKLKANYREHLATHNIQSKKPFTCEICKGKFVNKAGFESHKKRFPGPHIKHVCEHCNFSFSKQSHIINHRCKKLLLEQAAARAREPIDEPIIDETASSPDEATSSNSLTQYFHSVSVADPLQDVEHESHQSEQIIIRDMAGQVIQASQIVHLDLSNNSNCDNSQQVYHVNVADWNMVAPFVIRSEPNTQITQQPSE